MELGNEFTNYIEVMRNHLPDMVKMLQIEMLKITEIMDSQKYDSTDYQSYVYASMLKSLADLEDRFTLAAKECWNPNSVISVFMAVQNEFNNLDAGDRSKD